jgi:hypothetical protein
MLYTAFIMNVKPNLPNDIFWGKGYSWRKDCRVNSGLALAAVVSGFADVIFAHTVRQWSLEARTAIVLVEFLAIALWALNVTRWIHGMDELHRRLTTSVMLSAIGATFFVMLLWHRLDRAGLFNAIFPTPKNGGSWDICTICHGFLLFVLFYGLAQFAFHRRYK